MPATLTYPGVYIEEIPSGVHTITGVATSITAFIGRAKRGPVDSDEESPIMINSFGDFERIFGGLWPDSTLGFAVRDFYQNGGSQALIVRLFHPLGGTNDFATLDVNSLDLTAASPGSWANLLRARIDHNTRPLPDGSADPDTFNVIVRDGDTGQIEIFRNVSVVDDHLRRIDKVLENESKLVRAVTPLPGARPGPHPDPQPGEDVWGDNTPATNSAVVTAGEASDGDALDEDDFTGVGKEGNKEGLFALAKSDLFNLLCIPGYVDTGAGFDVDIGLTTSAATYCEARQAMLLIDPPSGWLDKDAAKAGLAAGIGTTSKNAALFFPRLRQPNPAHDNQKEDFAPCGAVAGVFARTDAQRGVWKAPAGLEATLVGVPELSISLNDGENGELNPLGINCQYIPVRRTALFLEESLYRGTQWVVFEPNDEPLWAQIRLNIGAFMQSLFRQGAFQGKTPREAYFVKCDSETTTQTDIDHGIVNILVGFAPLKPAEFVIIKIQQLAGQIET